MSNIGQPLDRLDGIAKVTGAARYAADWQLPGQLHAAFVSAAIPAGRVRAVNAARALAVPGVARVLTAADMPRVNERLAQVNVPPLASRLIPLQDDTVLFHGQPVAMVLAETPEAAIEAAALVDVAYDAAPFVVPDTAPAQDPSDARGLYAHHNTVRFEKGDARQAVAAAAVQVRQHYSQRSRHANPIEPSATLACWDEQGLTVYDTVQHLSVVQTTLATAFGLDAAQVRVISPHTGGGFGVKGFVWPHEILAAMAAKAAGRPVKLVLTRAQMYEQIGAQPQMTQDVALGAGRDGVLQGIEHSVANITGMVDDYVEWGTVASKSFYASPNIRTVQEVRRGHVVVPSFTRSPKEGPGSWALGCAMDELAHALHRDPLDLRVANHADGDPETGLPWSSKALREAYAQGAQRFGWYERSRGGTRDGHWHLGWGMADCSYGQARFPSTARLTLCREGSATIESSFCDLGTGPATVFAQVAAQILGIDPLRVKVIAGDTRLPYAGPTYGSATTISTGSAVVDAAHQLRARLADLAGWPQDEVVLSDGHIRHRGGNRDFGELLASAGLENLSAEGCFSLPDGARADYGTATHRTRSFGVIFVEVAVDPELGLLRLRRATGMYSAGRILNAKTARSQMIGGIAWGWGIAAMEASHFEPALGRWLSKDLAGVVMPVNADIPHGIDVGFVDEYDEHCGPLGGKGIGELATTGVAAAVGNAVFDAIGVRFRDLPITPAKIVAAWQRRD